MPFKLNEILQAWVDGEPNKNKLSPQQKKLLIKKMGNLCKGCGTHKNLSIDHIIPFRKGGTHKLENLQILCRSCNSIKGNKLIQIPSKEWDILTRKSMINKPWHGKYHKKGLTSVCV